ncbi:MAG: acyl carrier protein [Bacteroidota bacterium]
MNALSSRVEHRIKYTITEEFQIPAYLLHTETVFKEDLGFDDTDMLFLSLALEDEFEFLFTEDLQVEEMNDLIKLVIAQLRKTYLNPTTN